MYLNGTHAEQSLSFPHVIKKEAIQERQATTVLHSEKQGLVKSRSEQERYRLTS